jgi:hypothetical protein
MIRICRWAIGAMLMLTGLLLILLAVGCASLGFWQMTDDWCAAHPDASATRCAGREPEQSPAQLPAQLPSQSWDQANLQQNDFGCPTAVYIAPNGVLEQCE